jgi:hypothetical protein
VALLSLEIAGRAVSFLRCDSPSDSHMLSHDFDAWIYGCVPVSSDDDQCSVPLDFPFLCFGEPLVGISLLLISENMISFNSFIFRPMLSLRLDKSFCKLTKLAMSSLIFVKEPVISLTSLFIFC